MSLHCAAITNAQEWNALAAKLPGASFLQSWEWGELKTGVGWAAQRLAWEDPAGRIAAAQILKRELRLGPIRASVLYVPKGPLLHWEDTDLASAVLGGLEKLAVSEQAIQIKIDPDLPAGFGIPGSSSEKNHAPGAAAIERLRLRGWRFSREQIQFRNTVRLGLRSGESELLARMKQKTRYNIRLASKHGVRVRPGTNADFPLLYRLYADTANRDGFILRPEEYYLKMWDSLWKAGFAQPFLAEVERDPVSGLVVFLFGETAWYMHGMSSVRHREKMPNHVLQWEAIRWAKRQGYSEYDFWGAPNAFDPSDSMWGVFNFKQGFGGEVVRHIGAWDFAPNESAYALYHTLLPRLLDLARPFARRRTQAAASQNEAL